MNGKPPTEPTKAQVAWLQEIASGKATYSLKTHQIFGSPGSSRRSNYLMTNALFDAGWARMVPGTCKHGWYYGVELTHVGRAIVT